MTQSHRVSEKYLHAQSMCLACNEIASWFRKVSAVRWLSGKRIVYISRKRGGCASTRQSALRPRLFWDHVCGRGYFDCLSREEKNDQRKQRIFHEKRRGWVSKLKSTIFIQNNTSGQTSPISGPVVFTISKLQLHTSNERVTQYTVSRNKKRTKR